MRAHWKIKTSAQREKMKANKNIYKLKDVATTLLNNLNLIQFFIVILFNMT